MRNHSAIVKAAGSVEELAERCKVSVHTVRSWLQRNSIPPDQWMAFVADGHATFEEIANPDARGRSDAAA